jgi:RNA polymerase sigma factor (sigma-70 family)
LVRSERFEEFYERVYPRVSAALMLAWSNQELAADATDEAFVRAYAAWDRVGRMASPDGWVFRVALNIAKKQARRDSTRLQAERRAAALAATGDRLGAGIELAELLAVLPPRQRIAVILRHVADLREQDIAEAMGVRRGTVASLLTTAHRRLRQLPQTRTDTAGTL